ncbi:hypothetical protein [Chryseobacterium muglaense]|uniref:DUF3408 domain-containing protein n=1 Tax=Chryseobacterium muglaense TaxID=2893752 RepID=A0ABR8ME57_9FLAO|nr:hypothetical protein [Chryseobacterium muglaense]MBD3906770.1 hypothetical protein [Chryseobacterium muglaense]
MSKKDYLSNLGNSLVDDSAENIVEKKSNEIGKIINNEGEPEEKPIGESENHSVNKNVSSKYKNRNTSSTSPKKEPKKEIDTLAKFSPSVKKILQKNNDLEYSDTTNTKISNEANRALKIISLSSEVPGYKVMSSLILDFYNKHSEEFKL